MKDTEYDIINGTDLFDFIYRFDSKDENLDKYNVSFNKNEDIDDNFFESYVSYFDMDGYLENIKKSYEYREDKIYNQFKIDYYRQNIKLNGYKYDIDSFIKKLDGLVSDAHPIKLFDMSWRTLIILLCCQSSFTLPYLILQKKYVSSFDDKILVSGGLNSIDININIKNDKVLIELNSMSYLKRLEDGVKTDRIRSTVYIELNKIMNDIKYEPLICVFSWKFSKMAK